jgi:hypothetical protein
MNKIEIKEINEVTVSNVLNQLGFNKAAVELYYTNKHTTQSHIITSLKVDYDAVYLILGNNEDNNITLTIDTRLITHISHFHDDEVWIGFDNESRLMITKDHDEDCIV